jgi:microcystin-dependent protein
MIPELERLIKQVTPEFVKRFHFLSDKDANHLAQHHTLGPGLNQAAPGTVMLTSMRVGDGTWSIRTDESVYFKICNGQSLSKALYPELFAIIGYNYGGSGANFNLPDLRDRSPVGTSGTKAHGSTGGAASVALTTSQLPSHTHGPGTLGTDNPGNHTHPVDGNYTIGILANTTTGGTANRYTNAADDTARNTAAGGSHTHSVTTGTTAATGSGSSITVQNPYMALNFFIRVK